MLDVWEKLFAAPSPVGELRRPWGRSAPGVGSHQGHCADRGAGALAEVGFLGAYSPGRGFRVPHEGTSLHELQAIFSPELSTAFNLFFISGGLSLERESPVSPE